MSEAVADPTSQVVIVRYTREGNPILNPAQRTAWKGTLAAYKALPPMPESGWPYRQIRTSEDRRVWFDFRAGPAFSLASDVQKADALMASMLNEAMDLMGRATHDEGRLRTTAHDHLWRPMGEAFMTLADACVRIKSRGVADDSAIRMLMDAGARMDTVTNGLLRLDIPEKF